MISSRPYFCLARLTLEAQSAHGIHSGRGDATHDVLLVRDANGLPALPGSSLAGVLRHVYREQYGSSACNQLFGTLGQDAQPSWLGVAWGLVHDSHDQPVEGLHNSCADDPVLGFLLDSKPLVRQRVRLNHRGSAVDGSRFDVTWIPAGVRYTTWLSYWCDGSETSTRQWQQLLSQLGNPTIRIGHGTRSGTGVFRVQALAGARWDLRTPEGRKAYCARPRSRTSSQGLQPLAHEGTQAPHVELNLQAEAGWRTGGGERSLNQHSKEPDLLPQHEMCVEWRNGKAALGEHYHLLPGSAIKGALRHRVAYHYRCLTGNFAGNHSPAEPEACSAVIALFGQADDDNACAGLLGFHDLQIRDSQTVTLMHNRIDRFTGGVMRGALFSEEVLWQTPFKLRIDLLQPQQLAAIEPAVRSALQRSLEDLAAGWLPLGASGSRGLGVFSDPSGQGAQWSDQGQWINGAASTEVNA